MIQRSFEEQKQSEFTQESLRRPQKNEEDILRAKIKDEIREIEWLDNLHNYPRELKRFIEENLTCNICLKLFEDPYEFNCKHRFCKECVVHMNSHSCKQNYLRCPNCSAIQSRDFIKFDGKSVNINILNYFLREIPIICYKCAGYKTQKINFEESKSSSQSSIWKGNLGSLEDHLLYCHQNFQTLQDKQTTFPCLGENSGCTKSFKTRASQIMHQSTECQFQWQRCFNCFQLHFGKYFKSHECKGGNLSEVTSVQIDFQYMYFFYPNRNPIIRSHQLLIIFESKSEDVLEIFITNLMQSLQQQFMFTIDEDHQHKTSKLITFNNTFLAENFITALNYKQIHASVLINVLKYDDSFVMDQVQQLEKSQLCEPGSSWQTNNIIDREADDRTVFVFGFRSEAALDRVCEFYGPVEKKQIFCRSKTTKSLCGSIQFFTKEDAQVVILLGKVKYFRESIIFRPFIRR